MSAAQEGVGETLRAPAVSADGNAVAYMSYHGLPGTAGVVLASTSVAKRQPDGWRSTDVPIPVGRPGNAVDGAVIRRFDPTLTRGILDHGQPLDPEDVDGGKGDLFLLDFLSGQRTWLNHGDEETIPALLNFGGATPDLSSVVFAAAAPLLSGAPDESVYRHDAGGLELVSLGPDGTPMPGARIAVLPEERYVGGSAVTLGGVASLYGGPHAVSDDTQRIYLMTDVSTPRLWLRDHDETVPVSVSVRADTDGVPSPSTFLGASRDGSVAFFASDDQLTEDAPVGGGIYRFNADTRGLELLAPAAGGLGLISAQVSDDASHIYFIATGDLASGATAGDANYYVWDAEGGTRYLGTGAPADFVPRVTPDGRFAVFASTASIGGAPTNGRASLYLYDVGEDSLVCASCRPDGSPSEGDSNLDRQAEAALHQVFTAPLNLSEDGALIFATKDQLLPRDKGAGADVYLYDGGALTLISSGSNDLDSYVAGNSTDMRDIFFFTRDRLVAADNNVDTLDLYDARLGGGFADPAPPAPCRDDDCQHRPGPQAGLPTAGSTTASGPGNVVDVPPVTKVTRSLRLSRLSAAERRRLARTGKAGLTVRVVGGGTIAVRATTPGGKPLGSGRRVVRTTRAVRLRVPLHLNSAARRTLARSHRLRLKITVSLQGTSKTQRTTITLTSAHR